MLQQDRLNYAVVCSAVSSSGTVNAMNMSELKLKYESAIKEVAPTMLILI